MGHHLTGATVLAATLLATSLAFADDEPSRRTADAEAEAAMVATPSHQPLGYAATTDRTYPAFARMRDVPAQPVRPVDPDRMFLEQGDRGLGNN